MDMLTMYLETWVELPPDLLLFSTAVPLFMVILATGPRSQTSSLGQVLA